MDAASTDVDLRQFGPPPTHMLQQSLASSSGSVSTSSNIRQMDMDSIEVLDDGESGTPAANGRQMRRHSGLVEQETDPVTGEPFAKKTKSEKLDM